MYTYKMVLGDDFGPLPDKKKPSVLCVGMFKGIDVDMFEYVYY